MPAVLAVSDQYRIAPLPERFADLREADFVPLEFVQDEQAIIFPNGTTLKLTPDQTTFVNEGTMPVNSTWALVR